MHAAELAIVVGLLAATLAIFTILTGSSIRVARRTSSSRVRDVATILATLAPVVVLWAAGALVRALAVSGLAPAGWSSVDRVVAPALAVGAVVAGVLVYRRARQVYAAVQASDRFVEVLGGSIPLGVDLEEVGLTAREQEIATLLATGVLSDEDLAAALHIAPSTAATHIRNILKKSGLGSRRELMLVASGGSPAQS